MRIQLWSYNYAPESTGIGIVSSTWTTEMLRRGHEVDVVAAHPHYPTPQWGVRRLPYREVRDGARVLRLPIWHGRQSTAKRLRQEASFAVFQTLAIPALRRPDVLVSVSPSFPALAPAMAYQAIRRTPWVVWLQDLLPDAAVATGVLSDSKLLSAMRRLEAQVYASADHLVVISDVHRENLQRKGVPAEKIAMIPNPSTQVVQGREADQTLAAPVVLSIGNIGLSQGHADLVRAFEDSAELASANVQFRLTGDGVAAPAVRDAIRSDRVTMLGMVPDAALHDELRRATFGLVSLRHTGTEFSVPSRMMNFMANGIPVLAVAGPDSSIAAILRDSNAGWLIDAGDPAAFPRTVADALANPDEILRKGAAGKRYAERHLGIERCADEFEIVLDKVTAGSTTARRA